MGVGIDYRLESTIDVLEDNIMHEIEKILELQRKNNRGKIWRNNYKRGRK